MQKSLQLIRALLFVVVISTLFLALPLVCFASTDIPENLEDCFVELERVLNKDLLEEFKNAKEDEILNYHHSIGGWMRDNWGEWPGSGLTKYFAEMGIFHPDDITNIILTSFHRYLNKKDISLQQQIEYYQQYWGNAKNP